MDQYQEFIFDIAQLQERRGAIPVVPFCAAAFFTMAGFNRPFLAPGRIKVKRLVAEALGTKLFQRGRQLFRLRRLVLYYFKA